MTSSKKATEQNIVAIPASGAGAPFVAFEDGQYYIRVNIYKEDGTRVQYEHNNQDWSHETMEERVHVFTVRKEICASGRINLDNWTEREQYDPNTRSGGTTGLSASGIAY